MNTRFFYLACLVVFAPVVHAREKAPAPIGYPLTPLLLSDVKLDEGFWADRMKTHVEVTIPHVLKTLGIDYADPKPGRSALALARTLEGVSYVLMMEDHKDLRSMMEKICVNIGRATNEDNRWFGAVAEAPVLFSLITGKENEWLKAALKEYKQREGEHFGKDGSFIKEPESHAYSGMAIISLYQATGDKYYRKLARKFMDIRGMPATGQRTWPQGTYANSTWVVTDENDKPLGYFIAGHQVSHALIPKQ